ncbi:DUF6298 domain-containing protein [Pelagicoccus enzymogenes]|uniref:DUF6298 domain-containing protein n=1 Tax=Pelagicoccus enzymogenes TaxID=2773457 RepID=UPI00280F854F|nr:DUF6298 domain-containing protein [Pelagicoccus enzymogenes]MDQ8197704.1 DUF6298 domain-containing protein [Pelagicoccus enzymogenes]
MRRIRKIVTYLLLALATFAACQAEQLKPVFRVDEAGRLVYDADARGNVVPDFSSAGYRGGGVSLPRVDAKVRVAPSGEDDTRRIQAAIDWVSSLPLDSRGIRGAVELAPGEFIVAGQIKIESSGVSLRGFAGEGNRTVLKAVGVDRRDLIAVGSAVELGFEAERRSVLGGYLPVGAREFALSSVEGLSVGDSIRITRPGSKQWAADLGMDIAPARTPFNWRGETVILHWDRVVVGVSGNRIQLDAPVTTALDSQYGQSYVQKIVASSALSQIGVEDLSCVSEYDLGNSKDENHSWVAVSLNGVVDSWVNNVTATHFALSAVRVGEDCRRVTVQDCSFLAPVSEIGGHRRQSFNTYGQQTLFLRCYSEDAIEDFTVGHLATGPNVFLDCTTRMSRGTSGSIGHWASGILFDNVHVDGGILALDNREIYNQGVGWAAANSVIYQSSAGEIITRRPPTANNWAIGVWALFRGDGTWIQTSEFADPDSLYRAQLQERVGEGAIQALGPRLMIANRMAVPELEQVVPELPRAEPYEKKSMQVVHGQLQVDGLPMIGSDAGITWWRGRLLPTRADQFGYSLTRFTPGRSGSGLTDDLHAVTNSMLEKGQVALRHHYGLWYDRRRDDHQMSRRSSSEVWAPFYEQPFARSGVGQAWDGLSKYDLFEYNPWYFQRLDDFAELAERRGLVLVNEMFFQHNIIESGAHWVDNPWRPVNALQQTEFTEPPPFKGDTIQMADEFYDIEHPVRREVNRAYIRKCLDNLSDQRNVIHVIGAEYTGPLHFMEFWLDVVAEWMEETGKDPVIGLSCPKDVQDAILEDRTRAAIVDVVDFQYWWYTDSDVFAPDGGASLAPRQEVRKWKGGRPSGDSLARMVSEYRERYPEKAVITTLEIKDPWAYALAGGSFAPLPREIDSALHEVLGKARPLPGKANVAWTMRSDAGDLVARCGKGRTFDQSLLHTNFEYEFYSVDAKSGSTRSEGRFRADSKTLMKLISEHELFWLRPI